MEMKKTLSCEYTGELWNLYPIVTLKISEIWGSAHKIDTLCEKPFKKNLIEDIKRDGMHFPIMVVKTTGRELKKQKEKYKERITELPFWSSDPKAYDKEYWSCWGGSQRLDVAERLGYTHIDCAIVPNVEEAIDRQKLMREPFSKRYYEVKPK